MTTTTPRTAIVLGASGSVGSALMRTLCASDAFSRVVTIARRTQPAVAAVAAGSQTVVHEVLIPTMDPASLEAATRDVVAAEDPAAAVVGFSVLGIGAGTAKITIDQHRAVDVALNAAFARGLAALGRVQHLAFMSAVGADAQASPGGSGAAGTSRYNRVKGEAEAAVRASGIPIVSIFRPSLILGSQHTPTVLAWILPLLSVVTPAKFRSISTGQIARAMVAAARDTPAVSAVYHWPEMMQLLKPTTPAPPPDGR